MLLSSAVFLYVHHRATFIISGGRSGEGSSNASVVDKNSHFHSALVLSIKRRMPRIFS
jgi:hypothetical protein